MIVKPSRLVLTIAAFTLLALPASSQNAGRTWVAAWSTSQQGLAETKLSNASIRMMARVTLPGDAVRIRLDNSFGKAPVTFDHATIGPRVRGVSLAVGQVKPITFNGKTAVTIPAGGSVQSDAVPLHVDAQQDLGISLFVSGTDVQPSQHNNAGVVSYVTENGVGDQTDIADGKTFTRPTTSMFWLKAIDVMPASPASTIVAFGDSITDGTCTTVDGHDRWEDLVAQRLALQTPVKLGVVNEGIGGNTIIDLPNYQPATNSPTGVARLDRDVLSHAGVSHVVLFVGTNDIRRGASADQVIGGLKDVVTRVKAKGIKIIGATIIPRHSVVPGVADTGWDDAKTKIRARVNEWIRKEAGLDAVLDFDRVVRSAANPDLLEPAYNCGDGIHPSPIGYFQMGKSVDLAIFGAK